MVGLIAPGGVVDDAIIQHCVKNLEGMGFTVKPGRNLRAAHGGYAGTVQQRLDDLHDMFRDREVGAIWTARGGSGALSLVPRIDYALARRRPKILIGFSDVTALHLGLLRHAGLVTFHGPVGWTQFSDFSVAQMRAVLMEPARRRVLPMAEENLANAEKLPAFRPRVFRAGAAQGRLVGGNLSVLTAFAGTPHLPSTKGAVIFLEEVGEPPYRIDRMLTQLHLAGITPAANGIAMGVFQRCEPADGAPSLTLQQTLEERMADLKVPAASGFSFGHIPNQVTLPVGVMARMDAEARTITLLEPAVA